MKHGQPKRNKLNIHLDCLLNNFTNLIRTFSLKSEPGPSSYVIESSKKQTSFNSKGTIPKSERTFLKKFNKNPGPDNYSITRYLEKN